MCTSILFNDVLDLSGLELRIVDVGIERRPLEGLSIAMPLRSSSEQTKPNKFETNPNKVIKYTLDALDARVY